jgi:hypothetical protein
VNDCQRAPAGEQPAKEATRLEGLPKSSEVLRACLANIDHGTHVDEAHEAGPLAEKGCPSPGGANLAKEVSEVLHLRRLLDSGELTQEEYLDRLHWR